MGAKSKKEILEKMRKQSIILGPQPEGQKLSSISTQAVYGISGAKDLLENILMNLPVLREKVADLRGEWRRISDPNPKLKGTPATGEMQQKIFTAEMRVKLREEESRYLIHIIEKAARDELEIETKHNARRRSKMALTGQYRGGRLDWYGVDENGNKQKVVRNDNGDDVFEDGTLVKTYIDRIKLERRAKQKAKIAEEKEMAIAAAVAAAKE